jgi:hypothetical protein
MKLSMSNKGWHSQWFYLKNDAAPSLPEHGLSEYTGHVIEVVPKLWRWGISKKDTKRIADHLTAIKILREAGMKGSGVIGVYHARRVAPLMAHALLMHRMVPVAQLEGTVLAEGPLADLEIAQRLKEVMDALKDSSGAIIDFVYPVPRHPPPNAAGAQLCQICKLSSSLHFLSPIDLFSPARLILCGVMPAEGPHAHGTPGAAAEERGREGGEPCLE